MARIARNKATARHELVTTFRFCISLLLPDKSSRRTNYFIIVSGKGESREHPAGVLKYPGIYGYFYLWGNLIFQVFGALAEFDLIRDRTNAGLAAARA
ncbi:MAG: hypothetical protein ACE1Y2_04095, partial [Stenotrophomonas maltophilia]